MARKGKRTAAREQKSDASTREYKAFKFELESADDESGEFSGYAAVFGNIDSGRDVIERGAFSKTIREDFDRIKILSQHNDCELPIGKPLELREDEKGLYIRGRISDTQKGRDIRTLLKDGVLNELSIGYDCVNAEYDGEAGIRHLREVKLWEVSIVTWAMNDQAKIQEVKADAGAAAAELKQLTDELRTEAKAGRITQARLNALKPFIAVVRELADILGPFLDPPEPELQDNIKKQQEPAKETKKSGIVFEIIR